MCVCVCLATWRRESVCLATWRKEGEFGDMVEREKAVGRH